MRCWLIPLVMALTMLPACTVYPYREAKVFADATGGEDAERSFWRAVQQKQWNAINTCLAPNFVFATPNGRVERAQALENIRKLDVKQFSMGDLTTEMNGNTFVVIYNLVLEGTRDGRPLSGAPQHRVSIWQRQKNSWVLIAHTVLANEAVPNTGS